MRFRLPSRVIVGLNAKAGEVAVLAQLRDVLDPKDTMGGDHPRESFRVFQR